MNKNKSLLWALVGLIIIIIVGVYVYLTDPFAEGDTTQTAQQDGAVSQSEETGAEETAAAQPDTNDTSSDTASGEAAEINAPTFDVVRVEPNGSTLIAGQATPGTQVEIVSGGQVIAKADAGSSGDFVAVVNDALEPGDHEIVLRSVGEGSASAESEEIATISVPKDDPAELLVMVTKPGEASRILTKPETATEETVAAAAGTDEAAQGSETETGVAEKPAEGQDETETASQATNQEDEPKTAMTEDTAGNQTAAAPAEDATSQPADEETAAAASSDDADQPQASSAEASEAPKADTDTAQAPASGDETSDTEVAMVPAETSAEDGGTEKSGAVAAVPQTTLRIDAVEIEDGRIFVAGSATPGGEVRVYADGEPIGSSTVSTSGRFLVEANKDLAVGDHIIGADLILQAGDAPSLRVAVPFTRPEGQMVAAVASPEAEQNAENAGQVSDSSTGSDSSAAVETAAKPETEQAGDAAATSVQSSTSQNTEQATETAAKPPETTDSGSTETANNNAQSEPEPTTETAQAGSQAQITEQGSADDSGAAQGDASGDSTIVASADTQDDATPTVVQPALEPRDSSVIIRRGDTLWQISRRIYGRGVRYTTIYLANADQIQNPDMIEPGQIFMVPDEPLENAEELHRDRIRSR
ncbi:LysM peptidoglycan-binding domain-containing protein [Hoeflea sp.]|uniref:LysM peptidoglycan-binding domain-containing protein n=1 Tax=Hoeflea sp. TaxID=1940281 RepID=UPI003B019946